MYTWGCNTMNEDHIHSQKGSTCGSFMISSTPSKGPFPLRVSSRRQKLQNKKDTISFNKKVSLPDEKNSTLEHTPTLELKSFTTGTASNFDRKLSSSTIEPVCYCSLFFFVDLI
ncbi:hypothetical protein SLEP1_g54311 [Rubroshorea leprosula]|uniref:Uncharacterized protein n=1 Tax=Rubroshorea leprosula TaxID=152421 RepID=A0AAV5MCF7_9ROSI|nr:hypothetical protein SLEP1_g54311 [Rubroshorea leprosula]